MKPPPPIIDGASVRYWAETSGIERSDACVFRRDGRVQPGFAGLAIAQYAGQHGCYLFFCDEEWETQNDTLHRGVDEARASAESLYPGISTRWCSTGLR